MSAKTFWHVTGVLGKNKQTIEVTDGVQSRRVDNMLRRNINPGDYVVLEGDIILEVVPEGKAEKIKI